MKVIELVRCPMDCGGQISVIVEDNKITSHGMCPQCDRFFSAEHLNFAQEALACFHEFMDQEYPLESLLGEAEREIAEVNQLLTTLGG